MTRGFAVVAIAGKRADGTVAVLQQEIIRSEPHTERTDNMQLFANAAANLAYTTLTMDYPSIVLHDDHSITASPIAGEIPTTATAAAVPSAAFALDRATRLRSHSTALDELEQQEDHVRYVILRGNQMLVNASTQTNLALLRRHEMNTMLSSTETRKTFLGLATWDDQPPLSKSTALFGMDIIDPTRHKNDDEMDRFLEAHSASWVDTRTTAPLFEPSDNQLALYATAMAEWQRRTGYCTRCGGSTTFNDGGTSATCTKCLAKSWPRQDPSMIAVISSRDGQRVLLGHAQRHPPKLYTVLAGFVEAGETFEAAVARETWEETGVIVDPGSVRYIGSQPWPFPQSCMIGFTATADDTAPLTVDPNELEHAAWFSKADVALAARVPGSTMQRSVAEAAVRDDPTLPLLIPPKGVIARKLIDSWLEDRPI
jgi:NADH pyrophosphatase NudC (nudix superfamily)